MELCVIICGANGMNRQNDRTRTCQTERMMTILIVRKYLPNRRILLYSLSPVQGTVDLISCYSHEEAPVLQWTLLYSRTRRVENDEEYIDSVILFDRDNSFL